MSIQLLAGSTIVVDSSIPYICTTSVLAAIQSDKNQPELALTVSNTIDTSRCGASTSPELNPGAEDSRQLSNFKEGAGSSSDVKLNQAIKLRGEAIASFKLQPTELLLQLPLDPKFEESSLLASPPSHERLGRVDEPSVLAQQQSSCLPLAGL